MFSPRQGIAVVSVVIIVIVVCLVQAGLPDVAANGLLHPSRRVLDPAIRTAHPIVQYTGAGITLDGWKFAAQHERRGTIVYLHGVADNRGSVVAPAERLSQLGFDVIAYDSRAHGGSGGDVCTYGYYEKRDLERVIDTIDHGPIFVIGSSLGGAVALQAAAEDHRIAAVVSAEAFSDLKTVATYRAPWFLTAGVIRRAFAIAEVAGRFRADDVSPALAAARITVPVLVIHGASDRDTPPAHAHRIYDALKGPRQLLMVTGAGHNHTLTPATWETIDRWLEDVALSPQPQLAGGAGGGH